MAHAAMAAAQIETEIVQLMNDHATNLSRYAHAVTREKSVAQDGVQETFLRYFIARTGGQHIKDARAWLFRVLRNYLLDCNRKSNFISAVDLETAMDIADCSRDAEAEFQQKESFRSALADLSPREKECMLLRREGFGYDEIACVLRIRPGTVAALLARGLKKIRKSASASKK
jgi:RNA polymerase sigma-70 factor, ECF subfamily